jgi:hypoxanthine-guanine phosphoribosyltransferase
MRGDLERVLFDEPAINRRLGEVAEQISSDYRDRNLTVIAVLNGSLIFMADLFATDSAAIKVGLPERGKLSRKEANERRGHFQTDRAA